jgi:hypothetical protein
VRNARNARTQRVVESAAYERWWGSQARRRGPENAVTPGGETLGSIHNTLCPLHLREQGGKGGIGGEEKEIREGECEGWRREVRGAQATNIDEEVEERMQRTVQDVVGSGCTKGGQ